MRKIIEILKIISVLIVVGSLCIALNACFLSGAGNTGGIDTSAPTTPASVSESSPSTTSTASMPASPVTSVTTGTTAGETQQQSSADTEPARKVKAKALYLTGWTAGSQAKIDHYIQLAETTEINAYVIDIKDDDGLVGYESEVPAVRELGSWMRKYDVDKVLDQFHSNGIHVIGRLVVFNDPFLSGKNPEYAIKTADGKVWLSRSNSGEMVSWVNPYITETWDYNIAIAREALEKGFDEIQFDYIRFPGAQKVELYFGEDRPQKHEAINAFLSKARDEMPGAILSADIFGIVCESPGDTEKIGQYLELVGKDIDYISPMVYPSHYALGQKVNGVIFAKPDFQPYDVVYNSLLKAKNRLALVTDGYSASIRPYLQDFTATWLGKGYYMEYGAKEVRQQIQAAYDAGCEEWILWDSKNTYDESAFLPE